MKRSFLEELGLDKETIDKVLDENSADIGKAKGELESTKQRLKEVEGELSTTKATLAERDTQLEDLRKTAGDNAELQQKITDLQNENKQKDAQMQAEITKIKHASMDELMLTEAGAKNLKAVKALLEDLDEADDTKYKETRETQIKALLEGEDTKFLFGSKTLKGAEPGEGGKDPSGKPKFEEMTYEQLTEYLEANPGATLE